MKGNFFPTALLLSIALISMTLSSAQARRPSGAVIVPPPPPNPTPVVSPT